MPRRKYQADTEHVEHMQQSIVGKRVLGGCLKAEGVKNFAIDHIYVNEVEIEGLPLVRYKTELFVDSEELSRWLLTAEGKRWAFPKNGPK